MVVADSCESAGINPVASKGRYFKTLSVRDVELGKEQAPINSVYK